MQKCDEAGVKVAFEERAKACFLDGGDCGFVLARIRSVIGNTKPINTSSYFLG